MTVWKQTLCHSTYRTPRHHPSRRQSLKTNKEDDDGPDSMLEERDEQEEETAAGAPDDYGAPESATAGYTYRVPRGACLGGVVGTTYVVDRTPDEVAQGLLSASYDHEEGGADEDENGSATDEENELREGEGVAQGEEQPQEPREDAAAAAGGGDKKKPGSAGGGKGKGKAAAVPNAVDLAAAAMADLPSYWRGTFSPLADEGLQALELEEGEEGLEEYFDKRYVVPWRGQGHLLYGWLRFRPSRPESRLLSSYCLPGEKVARRDSALLPSQPGTGGSESFLGKRWNA